MSPISLYLIPILYIIYIATTTLILQNLAKSNEWDASFKKAFMVIFIWITITYIISIIIQIITENLSFAETQVIVSFSFYIITLSLSLGSFLILGPFIVKKFYNKEFRESFSTILRVLLYEAIVQSVFLPLYLI